MPVFLCPVTFFLFVGMYYADCMKVLTLMRHAKSSWKDTSLDDEHRGLNKRGRRDVALMTKVFTGLCEQEAVIYPDLLVSSTALRAKLLARSIAERLSQHKLLENTPLRSLTVKYQTSERCYTFDDLELLDFICSTDDAVNSLMIVGHNPALTELISRICPLETFALDNLPTSAFVCFSIDVQNWSAISSTKSVQLLAYDFPKNSLD